MQNMRKLTKQVIDLTPCPSAGQVFIRDTELPGFALRVTKGRKSFVLEKRIRGRMRPEATCVRLGLEPPAPCALAKSRPRLPRALSHGAMQE